MRVTEKKRNDTWSLENMYGPPPLGHAGIFVIYLPAAKRLARVPDKSVVHDTMHKGGSQLCN